MQNTTLTLNRLPVLTWNRLRLNGAAVSAARPDSPCAAVCNDRAAALTPDAAAAAALLADPRWAAMETGMGPDFTALLADAPVTLLAAAPDAGPEAPEAPAVLTLDAGAGGAAPARRVALYAPAGSTLSVALALTGTAAAQAAVQILVLAEQGAAVRLAVAQLAGETPLVLTDVGAVCAEDARFELVRVELGGQAQYTGAAAALQGRKSTFTARAGYRVRGGRSLDMNYVVRHRGKKTVSDLSAVGVLEQDAAKLFRGTIDFPRGCAGAKGSEKEEILFLGNKQVNQTIPLILCKEEDVEGDHGATIGRLPEQVLFYLGSRGIPPKAAEDLIARAKLEAVCALLPDGPVRALAEAALGGEGSSDHD